MEGHVLGGGEILPGECVVSEESREGAFGGDQLPVVSFVLFTKFKLSSSSSEIQLMALHQH